MAEAQELLDVLKQAKNMSPMTKAHMLEMMGDVIFRKEDKQFMDALELYLKASELNPHNFEIYIKQGKCYEKQREFDNATACF